MREILTVPALHEALDRVKRARVKRLAPEMVKDLRAAFDAQPIAMFDMQTLADFLLLAGWRK